MRFHLLSLLCFVALFGQGCDKSGLHPLGTPLDRTTNCGRSTWLRSTDTGTEIFLSSKLDITEPADPDATSEPNCFVRAFVEHDTTARVEQGTYVLDENGEGEFRISFIYTFTYQPERPILNREGARRQDLVTPEVHSLSIAADGDEILLDYDGEPRRLTSIYDVIANVDPSSQEGAEDVFRLINLPLFTSQARVLGFGSAGMTMYANSTTTFEALVGNHFTVIVKDAFSMPDTYITYFEFEDLAGIVIDGVQNTKVNLMGNGGMDGVLDWHMRGSDFVSDIAFRGTLDYAPLRIGNGVAGGGHYVLTIEGNEYEVSYELASNIDLRRILPVSTP